MDFTISTYRSLIKAFLDGGYTIVRVQDFLESAGVEGKVLVLRHDVDEQPQNALEMAKTENELGVKATYYFRRVPKSDHPEIIRQVAAMGHEVGYHYEDLSKTEGDMDEAIKSFKENLEYFRQYYPVKTVCMHGSSSSKYDNRDIWSHINLADCGLIGEPYLSFDFNKIYYLTDTGYAWDGGKFAVRDIVSSPFSLSFHHSQDIIEAVHNGSFPQQALVLAHTLWTDSAALWSYLHIREFFRNRVKILARKSKLISRLYNGIVKIYWK